jgi:hypothetical protein
VQQHHGGRGGSTRLAIEDAATGDFGEAVVCEHF